MSDPVIELRTVRATRGGRRILDIPALAVHPGRLVVLRGPNGAGKTTLMKVLAGLLEPDEARVAIEGRTCPWPRARRALRRLCVYMHQQPYLFRTTVTRNVAYGLHRTGVPRREIPRRVRSALEWAGLGHLAGRDARTLSGGEAQRLALCRARVLAPAVLLLDEPTANMDPRHRARTLELVHRLRDEGMSLILSSHDTGIGPGSADEEWTMSEGALRTGPVTTGGTVSLEPVSGKPRACPGNEEPGERAARRALFTIPFVT